jgi:acetoin utilization protein AcuC
MDLKKRGQSSVATAFIYNDKYVDYDYGAAHPMKTVRLRLTHELIKAYGLLELPGARFVESEPATISEILQVHTSEYVKVLQAVNDGRMTNEAYDYGLGPGDNPVFPGVWDWSLLSVGGTLTGARLIHDGEVDVAFSIAGGLHHAMPNHAGGFCYLNDAAVAIRWLVERGKRVAYVDIDAHHGDGVQFIFYDSDQVLTASIHQSGRYFYPQTGFEDEIGEGLGLGFAANVPCLPYSHDDVYVGAFKAVIVPVVRAFRPDVVVAQLGVDTFHTDPLAQLDCTTNGFCEMVGEILAIAPKLLAMGGGGYDVLNVARAWTLAWGMFNGVEPPNELPPSFTETLKGLRLNTSTLRDAPYPGRPERVAEAQAEAERIITYHKRKLFPFWMS